jgi:hypothetical protein
MQPLADARCWRDRAEEAMALAEGMRDPVVKRLMLEVAEECRELAAKAEQRERSAVLRPPAGP